MGYTRGHFCASRGHKKFGIKFGAELVPFGYTFIVKSGVKSKCWSKPPTDMLM